MASVVIGLIERVPSTFELPQLPGLQPRLTSALMWS